MTRAAAPLAALALGAAEPRFYSSRSLSGISRPSAFLTSRRKPAKSSAHHGDRLRVPAGSLAESTGPHYCSRSGNTILLQYPKLADHVCMKVLGKDKLKAFQRKHSDARSQVDAWIAEAEDAHWNSPHDVLTRYPSASVVGKSRVVFKLKGNRYRLEVTISYGIGVIKVMRVGTHAEYDSWTF